MGLISALSWVTVIWSTIAAACLTLGAVYFLVWRRNRTAWAHLLFSATAASTTAYAICELWIMRARTPAELAEAMRWGRLGISFLFVSLTWFVWFYLGAGRRWLAWTITGHRAIYVMLIFLAGMNVDDVTASSLGHIQFLGESVTVFGAVSSPLLAFGQLVVPLMLVFVWDASVTAWRRGDRRKAWMVGGGVAFFVLAGLATSSIVLWGNIQAPLVVSHCYLGLVAVMAYELSRDVLRASELVRELQISETGLRESDARMSLAVDAADLGIWTRDLGGNEIWTSEKWRQLFGFGPSAPLQFTDILERLHPDDRNALEQADALAIAEAAGGKNRGTYQTDYRIILPDGAIRWIASLGSVEVDAAGHPVLVRGAARDVTEHKRDEQETQRLRQEIAHAGRVSMMGQLASGLAHEINQPLAAILRNAEAAELFLQHSSPDLDEVRAILTDIRLDDERAGHVIDRMRNLLTRRTLATQRLDVGSLVRDVAALVRVDAATRHVKLDVHVEDDLPPVLGDRVQLQQVLLNLILNGMDALNGARAENRYVRVTARLDSACMTEVAVGDGGPGIPPARLAQIFEPFFTTKPNGMGMGLAISRTIIEAHRGRLWAENQDGGGAAFRFTLPTTEPAAE
jgi:PAS domain S-box-containing protein